MEGKLVSGLFLELLLSTAFSPLSARLYSLCPFLGQFMPSQLLGKTMFSGKGGSKNKTWKKGKKLHSVLIKKLLTFYIMNCINF